MDQLITVYVEDIKTGGQFGFEWFEYEQGASEQLQKVNEDIKAYGKELEFKAVKRIVDYDRYNNRVHF